MKQWKLSGHWKAHGLRKNNAQERAENMVFSEGGWKAEVEIKSDTTTAHGTMLELLVIEILCRPDYLDPEATPAVGDIFTAFR